MILANGENVGGMCLTVLVREAQWIAQIRGIKQDIRGEDMCVNMIANRETHDKQKASEPVVFKIQQSDIPA